MAVKLLHPHLLPDATSRRRLEGEARGGQALSHPAIAAVYDVSGPNDDPALVMELVDGEALSKIPERDGPMPPKAGRPGCRRGRGAVPRTSGGSSTATSSRPTSWSSDGRGGRGSSTSASPTASRSPRTT